MAKLNSRNIVVIVPDPVLSRSLAFALEADGYRISTFETWPAASADLSNAVCIITDQKALGEARAAAIDLDAYAARIVLLTEDAAPAVPSVMQVLVKPLSGADVLSAVDKISFGDPGYV